MKVVFVCGPTASGKSEWGLQLAKATDGVIVNCDSIQLYQGVPIGSAMPSLAEREQVPHYLFEIYVKGFEATVGDYYRKFFETLASFQGSVETVYVVGGTGFYFQAIEKGLFQVGAVDPVEISRLEERIQQPGQAQEMHRELMIHDPESAGKISVNDHYRVVRALEIFKTHGKTKSEVEKEFKAQQKPFPYPLLKLGIESDRAQLEPRVRQRVQTMIARGLLEEVKSLLAEGYEHWGPLSSIGYRECVQFLRGEILGMEALADEITKNTLRFGKRQRTWFRRDSEIQWFPRESYLQAQEKVQNWLRTPSL